MSAAVFGWYLAKEKQKGAPKRMVQRHARKGAAHRARFGLNFEPIAVLGFDALNLSLRFFLREDQELGDTFISLQAYRGDMPLNLPAWEWPKRRFDTFLLPQLTLLKNAAGLSTDELHVVQLAVRDKLAELFNKKQTTPETTPR